MGLRQAGQVAVLRFPRVDLIEGKARPVLLIARVPGGYEDWLVCMFSTQIQQGIAGFDEVIDENQDDFRSSGLKVASVVRIGRLAVVSAELLVGALGAISPDRLKRIRNKLSQWILGEK